MSGGFDEDLTEIRIAFDMIVEALENSSRDSAAVSAALGLTLLSRLSVVLQRATLPEATPADIQAMRDLHADLMIVLRQIGRDQIS